ncbi:MAG TPA: alkaline phosphatase family protein [Caulobacteraceae bacterium]
MEGAAAPAESRPRLIVTIVVDQFGANLFNQYRPHFTGGLRRLALEGLVYASGYQTHGMTETCPGHSTVLTGVHPNRTGIAANDWIDREAGRPVYCLAAPANTLADGGAGENGPVGPDALRSTGLGDWLKAASGTNRVYAVSGKDRGAINLAGAHADGTFWYADGFGFTTYLRPGDTAADRLRAVAALNGRLSERMARPAPLWATPDSRCEGLAGAWTVGGETFESRLPPTRLKVDTSPVLDELTLEAAEALVREQNLGGGEGVDLLGVSLSGTDRIGHRYGSQGPEMCQQLHRLDAALGRFLEALESVPGGVLVVLTADHGGSDFVERLSVRGYPEAQRADPTLLARLNGEVRRRISLDFDPLWGDGNGVYVLARDRKGMAEPMRSEVAVVTAELLRAEPGVRAAFAIEELVATREAARSIDPESLTVRDRLALSAVPGRSADVIFVLEPGMTPFTGAVGGYVAGHGTPWDYDRRVPIVFWRPGASGQERALPIRTVDIGPTLAGAAGVAAPQDLDGRCLDLEALGLPACD